MDPQDKISFYISYETHSYCTECAKWQDKKNKRCVECNGQLRRKPRFTKDEDRWLKAY
jgi:hypothetical protein